MPDLMEKCKHFLQEKSKKLDPLDPEHLNLLAIASTHNLSVVARDLIPKVANLSVVKIRKYYGVIKPSLLMCVMDLMLQRYVVVSDSGSDNHKTCVHCRAVDSPCACIPELAEELLM